MGADEIHDTEAGRVVVGPTYSRSAAPDDVLPAVVRDRSDDAERYICYSRRTDADRVASTRLSVDTDAVVSLDLWR
jgi:hypothetical protein